MPPDSKTQTNALTEIGEEIPKELFARMLSNAKSGKITRQKYPDCLKKFACTLQFYSKKAYNYVRKTFGLGLPHQAQITSWYSSIDGSPGFTKEAFAALELRVAEMQAKGHKLLCNLTFDEMSIRKQIEHDGHSRAYGYVDLGIGDSNEANSDPYKGC